MSIERIQLSIEEDRLQALADSLSGFTIFQLKPQKYCFNSQYFVPVEKDIRPFSLVDWIPIYFDSNPWIHWPEPINQIPLYFVSMSTKELYAAIRSQRKTS